MAAEKEREVWEWRVGALLGWGECAWQQYKDRVQKITILVVGQGGRVGLVKAIAPVCMAKVSPDFDAGKVVVVGEEPTPDLVEDLQRFWSGGRILMGNANPALRREP